MFSLLANSKFKFFLQATSSSTNEPSLFKEELAGGGNKQSASDEVKDYLKNQKTDTGGKIDIPQELLDNAKEAGFDAVKFPGEFRRFSEHFFEPICSKAFSPISTALLSHQIIEFLRGFPSRSTTTRPCI